MKTDIKKTIQIMQMLSVQKFQKKLRIDLKLNKTVEILILILLFFLMKDTYFQY